ncbi:MAG TPA: MmcQ/YjbR family DNA-binding protein [Acidimicrobiales bacterium]|jgi:hypothetical protein
MTPAKGSAVPKTPAAAIRRIRGICEALPEVVDKPFAGHTAAQWRVRDKFFAMTSEDGKMLSLKGDRGAQQALIAANPDRYYVPKYVGSKGWVGVWLTHPEGIDWDELEELILEAYCLIAPKTLVKEWERSLSEQG